MYRNHSTDGIDDYDNIGLNLVSTRLPAVGPVVASKQEMNTTPPRMTELLATQAKHAYCQQIAATVRMPGLCYLYDRPEMLVSYPLLDRAIQTMVPNSLYPRFLTSLTTRNWLDTWRSLHVRHLETGALLNAHGEQRLRNSRRRLLLH